MRTAVLASDRVPDTNRRAFAAVCKLANRPALSCSGAGFRKADLEWSQVEFGRSASLHVRRAKDGKPSVHPLRGDEIRALRELQRQFPDSKHVFATERGGPFTTDEVNWLIKPIGERAGFPFKVHAHMLRDPNAIKGAIEAVISDMTFDLN
jgi:type 1 fimbriae regulatory protein FimB/type 1 fimbriae regulatory protein FimE